MNVGKTMNKEQAMRLAIETAKKGLGYVCPNPPVGAVVLDRQNRFLAAGWHLAYGREHAEIMALSQIKDPRRQLEGAVFYVTLEPCSHHGKTPPCAEALARHPLSKVCFGLTDPHPKVQGKGESILKAAGIKTEIYQGPLEPDLKELIEVYQYNLKHKKPFVAVKIAASLDGKIRGQNKRWLTGKSARKHVSFLRGCYDAVCIGSATLLKDNPRLDPRHPVFSGKTNYVVLLDPKGESFDFLKSSQLIKARPLEKVIVVTSSTAAEKNINFCRVLKQDTDSKGLFNLDSLLKRLFEIKIHSLLVEGGGLVFSSFLSSFQRVYLFSAPLVIGRGSLGWSDSFDPKGKSQRLSNIKWTAFDEDILVTAVRNS